MAMVGSNSKWLLTILSVLTFSMVEIFAASITCHKGPCFLKKLSCPTACPYTISSSPKGKVCCLNCNSPICQPECKCKSDFSSARQPNCNSPGSACYDARFIGGDGIVFYFHGKSNEHFSLASDSNLQINARFIGHRPSGRTRDFTWIQVIGILFDLDTFSLEATKAEKWDDEIDHLKSTHNGVELVIPEGDLSSSQSPQESNIRVERTSNKNSVLITLPEVAEISINVVPITEKDARIHNYQMPSDDCFVHLDVQFKFYGLSSKAEWVIGRIYRPDFENPAKPGVAMAVVGGKDKVQDKFSALC